MAAGTGAALLAAQGRAGVPQAGCPLGAAVPQWVQAHLGGGAAQNAAAAAAAAAARGTAVAGRCCAGEQAAPAGGGHQLTADQELTRPEQLPLWGKRVLITAPRQYASKLSQLLVTAGASPLWVPGVTITELEGEARNQLDAVLSTLLAGQAEFTHIAFTSKNGIYATMQRLAALSGGMQAAVAALARTNLRLCALGADGNVLKDMGLPVHVSPAEASTQGLVRELVQRGEAAGAHVLCPVPLVAGGLTEPAVVPRFLAALSEARAHATRVDAYLTTAGASAAMCAPERGLLEAGHVDAIAFSSTAEAQGLVLAMGPDGRSFLQGCVQRHRVVLAAHGPYTADGAGKVLGMSVACVSSDFRTFGGLVTALGHSLKQGRGG